MKNYAGQQNWWIIWQSAFTQFDPHPIVTHLSLWQSPFLKRVLNNLTIDLKQLVLHLFIVQYSALAQIQDISCVYGVRQHFCQHLHGTMSPHFKTRPRTLQVHMNLFDAGMHVSSDIYLFRSYVDPLQTVCPLISYLWNAMIMNAAAMLNLDKFRE